jgi:CRP/FNR family cyclic AMP-dependent transcriptional regulator
MNLASLAPSRSNTDVREFLAGAPILRDCTSGELDTIAHRVHLRMRPAGSVIYGLGELADDLCIIVRGRVQLVVRGDQERELVLRELGAGDFFGEAALLDDTPHAADVLALEAVTLLVIPRAVLAAHVQHHPGTALLLASVLAERLRASNGIIAELTLHDVEARLARTLVRLARLQDRQPGAAGLVFVCRPTHRELAMLLGTRRETVTRAFAALARDGMLVRRGSRIVLTPALLEQLGADAR